MPHLSFCLILPCFYRANCFLPLTRSFHSGDMPRKYSTTSGTASRMRSISSSVFHSHRLRRSEPCATSCGRPMASSTWLGSSEPDVHALPDDAVQTLTVLGALPECTGRVVLLPYRAVGVTGALLPAFRPDSVMIDGAPEPMLLALSAQALTSDGAFSMVLPPKS